jgi:hypothetical protein
MSYLTASALLVALSAGSAGLLATFHQLAQPFDLGFSRSGLGPVDSTLGQLVVSTGEPSLGAIAPDICLSLPDWQRPSELAHLKQLEAMPRYGADLHTDPLADMAKAWWSHEIFSFTTYGLSARTDPLYLSGVWTALDDTWNCYSGDQPEAINRGELAEVWLLHHRLVGLDWQDGLYRVTVEPVGSGLQLVQFPRQESEPTLPLQIMTTAGQALAVMSGDW